MSLVSFVKISRNGSASIEDAIRESLDLIKYPIKDEIHRVVIKPNLCYYWDYSTGHTTDPQFIAALASLIRKRISSKVEISIVESDASAMKCKYAFRMLGYEDMAEASDVRLVNLSDDLYETRNITIGKQTFTIRVPQTILKADLRINVPKIKYAMKKIELTCALKNIFGCNPYPKKFRYHSFLGEAIVAVNKAMKFDLCIVDGNIVSGIQARRLGLVMASEDPVAIDVAAAQVAGINPRTISYIQLASQEGLGRTSFIPRGVSPDEFKNAYPKKNVRKKLIGKAYNLALTLGLTQKLGFE